MLSLKGSAAASRLTPGAGRILDFSWPAKFSGFGGAIGNPGCFSRGGNTIAADNTSSNTVIGTGNEVYQLQANGTPHILYTSANHLNDNGFIRTIDAMNFAPNLGAQGADMGSYADDFACWRATAVLRFGTPPNFARDQGIQWTIGAIKGIITNHTTGFGFTLTATDTISFVWASGGLIVGSRVVRKTSVADLGLKHCYEVRIIGATVSSNAKLKVMVDGVTILILDWVVDALPYPTAAGAYGFGTVIITNSGGDMTVDVAARVRFMAAPTEEALL